MTSHDLHVTVLSPAGPQDHSTPPGHVPLAARGPAECLGPRAGALLLGGRPGGAVDEGAPRALHAKGHSSSVRAPRRGDRQGRDPPSAGCKGGRGRAEVRCMLVMCAVVCGGCDRAGGMCRGLPIQGRFTGECYVQMRTSMLAYLAHQRLRNGKKRFEVERQSNADI